MASRSHPGTQPGPVFYGRFSDGKTAAAADAELRLGTKGVEIKLPGVTLPLVWPYETLSAAEPLTDYAIDALLSSTVSPGASLFATEGTFARRLAGIAPQLTAKAQRWKHAKPWFAGTALVVVLGVALSVLHLSPSHAIATMLPNKARAKLGSHVIASMTGDRRVCDDARGVAALNRLTEKLSKASGSSAQFTVTVVDWGLLNAFAVPGERIITTRKLIAKAESADEVAGVLAHEMGHGLELHPETGIVRAIGLSAAIELMLGGSGGTLANVGVALATLSYSRDAEREADAHALRIMKNAGIAPQGFAGFFKRMKKEEVSIDAGAAGKAIDMMRTHPNTDERIAKIEAQTPYPAKSSLSGDDWQALKGICGPAKAGSDDDGDGQDDATAPVPKDPAQKDPGKQDAPKKDKKSDKRAKPKPGRDI